MTELPKCYRCKTEPCTCSDGAMLLQGDARKVMGLLPEQSVDLVFGSPPYEDARTYGLAGTLKGEDWVSWMIDMVQESLRLSRGLVAFVVEGRTRGFRWSATPAMLIADLHRAGVHLRKPPVFYRIGICGGGGPDWLRNDYEFIVCCTNGGQLPWSDNTAMGHPPKYGPGGEMSYRTQDGQRKNARDKSESRRARRSQWGHTGSGASGARKANGSRGSSVRPSHKSSGEYDGVTIANPGNVIHCRVGGGAMGNKLAHENEAPFPESLAKWFVLSFCPPGGTVLDPFFGSGTTLRVAKDNGRRGIGIDVRESQCKIAAERLRQEVLF